MIQAIGNLRFQTHQPDQEIKKIWRSYAATEKALPSPTELQEMVGKVVLSLRQKKEAYAAVDFLAKILPSKLIEEAVRLTFPDYPGALAAAENLSLESSHYLAQMQSMPKIWSKDPCRSSSHSFFVALESFLKSVGLIDLFKPVIGPHEEETKGQKMILLSTLFSTLTTTLVPLMGPVPGGLAIGGFFLSLVVLGILYPLWRPLPNYLPKVENWTEKYGVGILETGDIRRRLLDQIIDGLKSSKQDHSQVMLVGNSGVGKTELVKTLVQAIANGDYPEFKGCQVFYIHTADLLSHTDWVPKAQSILSFFSDAISGYRDQIIFVFDQIHMAGLSHDQSYISEQFSRMFDHAKEHFPHVIGLTTESDFQKLQQMHINFSSRFQCIPIEGANEEETLHILRYKLLKLAPEILVEDHALHMLWKKTREVFGKEASMPKTAVRILSKCIQRASIDQQTPLSIEVKNLRRRIEVLCFKKEGGYFKDPSFYGSSSMLRSLQEELQEKEKKLELERGELAGFFERRRLLLDIKKTIYELALKISSGGSQKEQKLFLIFSCLIAPSLEKELGKEARLLGIRSGIDLSLIDEVLAEETLNQKKLESIKKS